MIEIDFSNYMKIQISEIENAYRSYLKTAKWVSGIMMSKKGYFFYWIAKYIRLFSQKYQIKK